MLLNATPRRRRQLGLTLIELVMVLVILVALAGLLVPQVDFLRRSSDKGTASVTMKNVSENLQLYRTLQGSYPDNWDSLTDGSTFYSKLPKQSKYAVTTLNANEASSLTKIGINNLLDHDDSLAYRGQPGDSGQTPRAVADGEAVVVVTDPDIVNSVYPGFTADGTTGDVTDGSGNSPGSGIYKVKLVTVGLGPNNQSIGQTMMSPPAYQGVDVLTEYNRYLVVFAVYDQDTSGASTKRAQVKAVLDSAGDFLNQEIIEFNENAIE